MSEPPPLGYVLKRAEDLFIKRMDAALREIELTMPQFSALHALTEHREGLSNADLARECFVTPQAMHGVLKLLEHRGLVVRPAEAIRGRERLARLTAEGTKRYRRARKRVYPVGQRAFSGLSAAKQEELRRLLETVTRSLEAD